MTKAAFPKRKAARSSAEKVTSLMEVKFFSFEEWISLISEKMRFERIKLDLSGFMWYNLNEIVYNQIPKIIISL